MLAVNRLFRGGCQQIRQNLKRHILERAGRSVPQLENVFSALKLGYLGDIVRVKILLVVSALNAVTKLLLGKIGQKLRENRVSALGVGFPAKRFDFFLGERGDIFGNVQSALVGKSLYNSVRARYLERRISCARVIHCLSSFQFTV